MLFPEIRLEKRLPKVGIIPENILIKLKEVSLF
jgi:hypothetical protein